MKCRCGRELTEKDNTRGRYLCYKCTRALISRGSKARRDRIYTALRKIAAEQNYTYEELPQVPSTYREFITLTGGFK